MRDWLIRLATLEYLVEAEPGGPIWLWKIRIRIIRYLLARYGTASTHEIEIDIRLPQPGDSDPSIPPPADPTAGVAPTVLVDHPPKLASAIAPILDDIRLVNDDRREVESYRVIPEVVWTWWRDEWCARR